MRPEKLYLVDIVEAAASIERFLSGISQDEFDEDDLRKSAVLQKLAILGEASADPAELCESHPDDPMAVYRGDSCAAIGYSSGDLLVNIEQV